MERLARIVSRLSASELGVPVDELLRVAGFPTATQASDSSSVS